MKLLNLLSNVDVINRFWSFVLWIRNWQTFCIDRYGLPQNRNRTECAVPICAVKKVKLGIRHFVWTKGSDHYRL